MPLLRYFAYVGGVLFALLLVANSYLPKVRVVESSGPRLPVIHLYAERRGPERIVFDTSAPSINPAAPGQAASADKGRPAQAANVSSKVRDAFAELPPSEASAVQPADAKKVEAKPPPRKSARRHTAPPMRLVYRQPQFGGWFGPQQRFW